MQTQEGHAEMVATLQKATTKTAQKATNPANTACNRSSDALSSPLPSLLPPVSLSPLPFLSRVSAPDYPDYDLERQLARIRRCFYRRTHPQPSPDGAVVVPRPEHAAVRKKKHASKTGVPRVCTLARLGDRLIFQKYLQHFDGIVLARARRAALTHASAPQNAHVSDVADAPSSLPSSATVSPKRPRTQTPTVHPPLKKRRTSEPSSSQQAAVSLEHAHPTLRRTRSTSQAQSTPTSPSGVPNHLPAPSLLACALDEAPHYFYEPHLKRKGWVVCKLCAADTWPPNKIKHPFSCPALACERCERKMWPVPKKPCCENMAHVMKKIYEWRNRRQC